MSKFSLALPISRAGGIDGLVLAHNMSARALKQSGFGLHNAAMVDDMLARVNSPSHLPTYSFDGKPSTPDQADEAARKLSDSITLHIADDQFAHGDLDKITPPIKTPAPAPGGSPTTIAGADANGGLVLTAGRLGVTYSAKAAATYGITVAGGDISVAYVAGTTQAGDVAKDLLTKGLLSAASGTGTGKGYLADVPKTTLGFGTSTATRCARLNEAKAVLNAHALQPLPHNALPAGAKAPIMAADATDDATSYVLAAAIYDALAQHVTSAALEIEPKEF